MRKTALLLVAVVTVVGIGGCGATGRSSSKPPGADAAGSAIGAVPGTMPSRLCTSSIYSGPNYSAVVRTSDDIVVGPLRFGTLEQATGRGIYYFRSSGRLVFGFKSPLTISGTSSRWIAVRVVDDDKRVKADYNPIDGGSPKDATPSADVAALETAVACGGAEAGFVQYNGGFTWQHATAQPFRHSTKRADCSGRCPSPSGGSPVRGAVPPRC